MPQNMTSNSTSFLKDSRFLSNNSHHNEGR